MPKATKICRVCGKEYKACMTASRMPGVFNWREVACSPECGSEYFRQVMAARGIRPTDDTPISTVSTVSTPDTQTEKETEASVAETANETDKSNAVKTARKTSGNK